MAALLKKRALAEYCQTVVEEGPRPAKRLQLVRRNRAADHWDFNVNNLDVITASPNILLPILVDLHHSLPVPVEVRGDVINKLICLLQGTSGTSSITENRLHQVHPTISTKVLTLLGAIATSSSETQMVLDEIITVANNSCSHKVVCHAVQAAHTLVTCLQPQDNKLQDQVLQLALNQLSTTNFVVKVNCLEALGGLCPKEGVRGHSTALEALVHHTVDQDNRVRMASFNALVGVQEHTGVKFAHCVYKAVCTALSDDYQCTRVAALCLIKVLADSDPEQLIAIPDSDEHVRLADHAFSQVCNSINDISVRIRTQAASILGSMTGVSEKFLHQTLDKKLMSNMKKRKSIHEKCRSMASSGEWSSGKRWADDAPKEQLDANSVQVISSGACGAFVHGLEDEFLEVRNATLDSICMLALNNQFFANQCLDFLVDMFNDEIEDVRLKAIQVLQKISTHIRLRPDQLEEILHALKDSWLDIRESLHTMLGMCTLSTTSSITTAVTLLLDNLKRYPLDRRSIHRCLRELGTNHPELVLGLVPQLLLIHPYFDGVEPSVQDGEYICKLILVLNAAAHCPTILSLLERHAIRHYAYLRDTMPLFVPHLKLGDESIKSKEIVSTNTTKFLRESLEKLFRLEQSSTQLRLTVYTSVCSDLLKLADIDPGLSPAANFAALYTQCMLLFIKILSTRNWLTPSSLSIQESGALKTNVDQLLRNTLRLRHAFTNISPIEEASVRTLRVCTLALQLVYVVHGSTGSALGLCDNFLEHAETLHRYLTQQNLSPNTFLCAVFGELGQLEEPRPGAVARILQPLLLAHPVPPLTPFSNPASMQMCWAEILEPQVDSELVHKLSAGLVVGVPLDAEIWHIPDPTSLRIRVLYPDHSMHLIIPSSGDLRKNDDGCYRLLTTVLVSAHVWSEACQVGISLVLDLSEQETLGGRKHSISKTDDSATTIQLCQPVKVSVWPKPIKKGI